MKAGMATHNFKEREAVPMVTEFQDHFRGKFDPSMIGKMDMELLKDLRSIHFDIKDDEKFRGQSEYKGNYTKQRKDGITGELLSDNKLRRGNFKIGEGPGDYRTIYRDKYKFPQNNY
jgi:hypothetical protein